MAKLALIGTPEVSSSGVSKKASRGRAAVGKIVALKESAFKTQLLQGITNSKTLLLGSGLVWLWEDISAYADPMQIHLAWVLAIVVAAEALTYKFSKIQ